MVYEWEGYMRDGMTHFEGIESLEIYEARMGRGMCLSLIQAFRDKGKKVVCNLNLGGKYEPLDRERFLEEIRRSEE